MKRDATLSGWSALGESLWSPARMFSVLAEKSWIWPPYLTQMVLGAAGAILILNTGVIEKSIDAPAGIQTAGKLGGLLGGTLTPWVAGLVVAAIAALIGLLMGGGVRYSTYLAMVGYARLPYAIGGLIQSALVATSKSATALTSVSLSPAAMLPAGTNSLLHGFLATLNPFDLWYLALLAIGMAALHRKPVSKGIPLAATLYGVGLIFSIIGVSFASSI